MFYLKLPWYNYSLIFSQETNIITDYDYSTEAPIFDKCHIFTIKWSIMKLFFLSVAVWWMKHRIYTAPHLRVSAYVCYILNYMSHNMNSPPQPFVNLNIIFTTTRWVTVWWRWRCFAINRTLTPVLHFRSDAQRSNKQKERKKLELERQVFNADHFSASEEAGFPSSLVRHGS